MTDFEVPEAIICSPFEEPTSYWYLQEGEEPDKREGRRPAIYYYPEQTSDDAAAKAPAGTAIELKLVNLIRSRVKQWRTAGYPGVTATTLELLNYWRREGRGFRFFFAQLESAETIIFLNEARRDFLQGLDIPLDEPSDQQKRELGYKAFRRYACKMATGSGKTTVMGMVAAWSILNKVNDRANGRYSDIVLVVCPNVTIRSRLNRPGSVRPASTSARYAPPGDRPVAAHSSRSGFAASSARMTAAARAPRCSSSSHSMMRMGKDGYGFQSL